MTSDALEREIDRLYQLPPGEFVAARNALAKTLRGDGRREDAERVKGLRRATQTAWAVNRVVDAEPEGFAAAVAAAEAVKAALAGKGSLQRAMAERRDALDRLVRAAEDELRDSGASIGPDATRRIGRTLEALVTPGDPGGVAGRLTTDLDPPGFDAVVGLALGAPPARRTAGPGKPARKRKPAAGRTSKGRPAAGRRKKTSTGAAPASAPAAAEPLETDEAAADARPDPAAQAALRERRAALRKQVEAADKALKATERSRAAAARAAQRTSRVLTHIREQLAGATKDAEAAEARLRELDEVVAQRAAELEDARRLLADAERA